VFDSPEHCEDYRDMFDYPAEGTPNPFGGARPPGSAGRPRAASRAPRTPWCGARRPRSKLGQTAGAMHPRLNSAGAASFSIAQHCQ
jgi:hypothetical protein